jgi:hypothetical protein
MGLGSALKYVLDRRRVISPNVGFMKQLKQFQEHLVTTGHLTPEAATADPIPDGLRCDNPLDRLLDKEENASSSSSSTWSCNIL